MTLLSRGWQHLGEMVGKEDSKTTENLEFNVGRKKGKHFLSTWLTSSARMTLYDLARPRAWASCVWVRSLREKIKSKLSRGPHVHPSFNTLHSC